MTTPSSDSELDEMVVNLYLGENFTQQNPNWRAQMKNPVLADAKSALLAWNKQRVEAALIKEYDAIAAVGDKEKIPGHCLKRYIELTRAESQGAE